MSNLIAWIIRAIPFGTIIMFGSMGEITTEKSGNLILVFRELCTLAVLPALPALISMRKMLQTQKDGYVCFWHLQQQLRHLCSVG